MSASTSREARSQRAQSLVAFGAGALFAIGLAISGMTLPEKVLGFLDVTGEWDPALIGVMGGAVLVYAIAWRFALGMERPVVAGRFALPTKTLLDARLIGGSALFGVGWGLSGFCPGPALVSLGVGAADLPGVLVFVATMLLGSLAHDKLASRP